ncbi:hypothetical protein GQ600_3983 [Phytophthora cactorum]|nr:hypothetical protein GQ600_3983 [Phytophthora cactorum]
MWWRAKCEKRKEHDGVQDECACWVDNIAEITVLENDASVRPPRSAQEGLSRFGAEDTGVVEDVLGRVRVIGTPIGCDAAFTDRFNVTGLEPGLPVHTKDEVDGSANVVHFHVTRLEQQRGRVVVAVLRDAGWDISLRHGVGDSDLVRSVRSRITSVALYNEVALELRNGDLFLVCARHQEERVVPRRGGKLGHPFRHGLEAAAVRTRGVNDDGTSRGRCARVRSGARTFRSGEETGKGDERSKKLHRALRLEWRRGKWKVGCLSKKSSAD